MFFKKTKVPVEVSARHCHLSKADLEKLFGQGYELKVKKQLYQPLDFAAEETITIKEGDKEIKDVRIVGPLRNQTQVEISKTDAIALEINPPVRLSGALKNSAGITLEGPKGSVELNEGLIVARRHLHCATKEAKQAGLRAGQLISVQIAGERALTFHCVEVRVREDYKLCLHLDTDEGNAAGINKTGEGTLVVTKFKADK